MNQRERILKALKQWISPAEAFRQAGTLKLATRVGEFRREGYTILSKWHPSKKFKIYKLTKVAK